jgi:hypothetical protein
MYILRRVKEGVLECDAVALYPRLMRTRNDTSEKLFRGLHKEKKNEIHKGCNRR